MKYCKIIPSRCWLDSRAAPGHLKFAFWRTDRGDSLPCECDSIGSPPRTHRIGVAGPVATVHHRRRWAEPDALFLSAVAIEPERWSFLSVSHSHVARCCCGGEIQAGSFHLSPQPAAWRRAKAFNLIAHGARRGVSERSVWFGVRLSWPGGGHPPGGLARARVRPSSRLTECVCGCAVAAVAAWWVCSRRGPQPGPESKRIKPAAALSSSHSSPVAFQQLTPARRSSSAASAREW